GNGDIGEPARLAGAVVYRRPADEQVEHLPDAGFSADPAPLHVLGADEGGELLGRIRGDVAAGRLDLGFDLGRVVRAHELAMENLDHRLRRARRDEDAVPY